MLALSGKRGRFQTVVSGVTVNHEFMNWEFSIEIDTIDIDGFEKVPDAAGLYWKNWIDGLAGGDVRVKGRWDQNKRPTQSIFLAVDTTVFLGFTATIGFTIVGMVSSMTPSTDVKGAGDFNFTMKVKAVTGYPAAA